MFPVSSFRVTLAATLAAGMLAPSLSALDQAALAQTTLAQTALEASPAATVQDELLRMAGQAGVIFAGEVVSVTSHPSFTPGSGVVEVAFRVDQPIRGCDGQSTYTLREWAGLWTGGHQRYVPGQRLLILLHAPSASGLSSPVGGQDGVIPVTGVGVAPKPSDTMLAQSEPSVDLRWVQARLPRVETISQSSRLRPFTAPSAHGDRGNAPTAVRRSPAGQLRSTGSTPVLMESTATVPLSSTTGKGITLRGILSLLGAWQAQQSNAAH